MLGLLRDLVAEHGGDAGLAGVEHVPPRTDAQWWDDALPVLRVDAAR